MPIHKYNRDRRLNAVKNSQNATPIKKAKALAGKYLRKGLRMIPSISNRKYYSSFIHEHKRTAVSLMPQKRLTKNAAILSAFLFLFTSINPAGGFFDSGYYNDDSYLSDQDIAFNLKLEDLQLLTTDDGYLVNSGVSTEESASYDRLETVEHQVKDGESINQIAGLYGLKPETLIWENEIVNVSDVKPGQVLRIPPADGVTYVVQSGDVLGKIASKYDINDVEIQKYNNLNGTSLKVGQRIFIPGGTRVTSSPIAENAPSKNPDEFQNKDQPSVIASNQGDQTVPNNYTPVNQINGTSSIVRDSDPVPNPVTTSDDPFVDAPGEVIDAPFSEGFWGMPTNGQVTQGYRSGHYALDIANSSRPPIWATAGGVVVTAKGGYNGGYGNHVIIDHGNGYQTLYAHAEELYVSEGETVTKGQVIAKMGNTGRVYGATGIHVHYECHQNGRKINPYSCMP